MLFIQYYQKRNLRIHQRNKGIWELKIISEIGLSSMANQVWQIFGTDAPTPPTCAHGRHHQSITRFFCWTLIELQNYFQFSERTIDLDRTLQLQVIEINWNHIEEIRRDFIQTCKGDPKKVKHNNAARSQEPGTRRPPGLCPLSMCVSACLFHFFSLQSGFLCTANLLEVMWPLTAPVLTLPLQPPTKTISESQHQIPKGETLSSGQVTTSGPSSYNLQGSDSTQNAHGVPTPAEKGALIRAGKMAHSLSRQPRDIFCYCYWSIGSGTRDLVQTFFPWDLDQGRPIALLGIAKMSYICIFELVSTWNGLRNWILTYF